MIDPARYDQARDRIAAAGFTPGSIPTTVIVGKASRRAAIAAAVAVLQATTMSVHPRSAR